MASLNDLMTDLTNIDNAVLAQKSALIEQGIDMTGVPLSQFGNKILEISGGPLEIPVVLSTTKPTPQENMMWGYTPILASGRVFTTMGIAPSEGIYSAGDVCIMLGTGNVVLNSGELELCPVALLVYNSEWQAIPSLVYKNEQWHFYYTTDSLQYYNEMDSAEDFIVNDESPSSMPPPGVTFVEDEMSGIAAQFSNATNGGALYSRGSLGFVMNPTIIFTFRTSIPTAASPEYLLHFFSGSGGAGSEIALMVSNGTDKIKFTSTGAVNFVTPSTTFLNNNWHVCSIKIANKQGGVRALFMNSSQFSSVTNTTQPIVFGDRFRIGNNYYDTGRYTGRMSHFMVYAKNIPDFHRIAIEKSLHGISRGTMSL